MRHRCRAAGIEYYADSKGGDVVYLSHPSQSLAAPGVSRINGLQQHGWRVTEWVQQPIDWQTLSLRPDARGILTADFAAYPVWTLREQGQVVAETLRRRRDATRITPLLTLAQRKSQRFFIERSIQDAKSELGFDEFQALKSRAWQHHLTLTILASWFIAESRLDWAVDHPLIPPGSTITTPLSCPPYPSPMSANCCAWPCRCPSFPLNSLPLWSFNTSITALVPVVPASKSILAPKSDFAEVSKSYRS